MESLGMSTAFLQSPVDVTLTALPTYHCIHKYGEDIQIIQEHKKALLWQRALNEWLSASIRASDIYFRRHCAFVEPGVIIWSTIDCTRRLSSSQKAGEIFVFLGSSRKVPTFLLGVDCLGTINPGVLLRTVVVF
jgi:hypothetical protein